MPAGSAYCIPEGMILGPLCNVDLDGDGRIDHVTFGLRNQFLHPNHPLGWIRRLSVSIDSAEASASDVVFELRGQRIALHHLPTITDIWWYMREPATIAVRSLGLARGEHRVDISFEISLQMHTPIVDREGIWPTLAQDLSAHLQIERD